jgi:oxygen-independent coproporphyrinogen-3 oxidase
MKPVIHHLYVHIPFCAKICPYCAFYVELAGKAEKQKEFVEALCEELDRAKSIYNFELKTIYFGGGTPSMLSAGLFLKVADHLPRSKEMEFSIEVNPATVTNEKAKAWKQGGINRISLGAQSFDSDYLKLLGRQHKPSDINETVSVLRNFEFSNINLDLMFALPNQQEEIWNNTLKAALDLKTEHVSAYALTYEEDTPFFEKLQKGEWKTDEAREIEMFEKTVALLENDGIKSYEISNFARPGFECRHNQAYWKGADFLGLGPSAWSSIGEDRFQNIPDTAQYVDRVKKKVSLKSQEEKITPQLRLKEKIMFGLRTREGIAMENLKDHEPILKDILEQGLAELSEDRVKLTRRGRLVADSVAALFA